MICPNKVGWYESECNITKSYLHISVTLQLHCCTVVGKYVGMRFTFTLYHPCIASSLACHLYFFVHPRVFNRCHLPFLPYPLSFQVIDHTYANFSSLSMQKFFSLYKAFRIWPNKVKSVSDYLTLHGWHSTKPNMHAVFSTTIFVEILSCVIGLCASHAVSRRLSSPVQGTLGSEDQWFHMEGAVQRGCRKVTSYVEYASSTYGLFNIQLPTQLKRNLVIAECLSMRFIIKQAQWVLVRS